MDSHYAGGCLNDEELVQAALEDEIVSSEKRKHLEQCVPCQQQIATFKNMHKLLLSSLYRSQCPTSMQLSSYCAGLLVEKERFVVASHVHKCHLCMNEVEDTRRFLADVKDIL